MQRHTNLIRLEKHHTSCGNNSRTPSVRRTPQNKPAADLKPAARITGQGMTEYIIIVALIAIASIAAVNFFGNSVQATFAGMAGTLAGKGGDEGRRLAEEAARNAEEESKVQNTLSNYDS